MILRDLIARKRDGAALTDAEWRFVARVAADRSAPDYQLAALLMATYLRGMDDAECRALTRAMLESGRVLRRPDGAGPWVDKHSTGGVGDKTSIVLAPLLAACGVTVPMMSGRGLGHTGGTLDKLESIPGFRTGLSLDETMRQLDALGCALIGQTGEIAPADKTLYALRDATATVECIPLIAASIMSKKLAEGLTGLVLDVKRGSGAFLPEVERGLALARTMVDIGRDAGVEVVALMTAMDRPLGDACGNALEIAECLDVLRGGGPADLWTVTEALAVEMLRLGRPGTGADAARTLLRDAITSGAALERFRRIVDAQGGDPRAIDDPSRLPQAPVVGDLVAPHAGIVAAIAPRPIGHAIIALGGGRTRQEDVVDPAVGIVFRARVGDHVAAGQPLATIHARTEGDLAEARRAVLEAMRVADTLVDPPLPWVTHRITAAGVEVLAAGV
ncbi:MAG: thymidine phosphorylase [Gemmatimonadaceae bacterium]|jgi:pyrimidine-nucleoside phosphorylase|nr:thymidine phosphorylase [Gemmatimonadaceae bacterium]